MTAVIYARYSSDNQREESIEGQIRECTAYAKRSGIRVVDTYIDRALSAKTDNRPQFQKMISDSSEGYFDTVLVWKLDRFARNRYDSAHYKNILKKNNVRVISATETISQGAEGILLESMLEGMAEYYSAELSEKITRGLTENALKCKFNGGTRTIGYLINSEQRYELDPKAAPLVLEAFKLYVSGKTMQEVTDIINEMGLRTARGQKLTLSVTQRMYGVQAENPENKYIILTVFTHLEHQKQGIGKALIQKIDEYAEEIGAEEVLIPASVYGLEFYRKLGYDFYNGNSSQNEDGEYILSKHFNKKQNRIFKNY